MAISSLVDTWILLRDIELSGERNRAVYILKSRGMAHSNQIREFVLTSNGIELRDAYLGPAGVLTGSARLALEAQESADRLQQLQEVEQRKVEYQRKCAALEAQISVLRADLQAEQLTLAQLDRQEREREQALLQNERNMAVSRKTAPNDKALSRRASGGAK